MEFHSPRSYSERTSSSDGPSPTTHTSSSTAASASPPSTTGTSIANIRNGGRPSGNPGRTRGRGRPATARRIWQQPVMQRRLIRLYLYTTESSLNTRQIGRLLSALANLEEEGNHRDDDPASASGLQSEIRSTQYQLSRLLSHGYHNLRPRSRELARERLNSFRLVRDGRVQKNKSSRGYRTVPPTSKYVRRSHELSMRPDLGDRASERSDSMVSGYSLGPESLIGGQFPKTEEGSRRRAARRGIRLSWVRKVLGNSSDHTPSSSVCSEIRSLLSRYSVRSSLISFQSSILPSESIPDFPTGFGEGAAERNSIVIRLCCQFRHDCLHRKVLLTVTTDDIPQPLKGAGEVKNTDLGSKYGRDKWNETALHLTARWAPESTVMTHLIDLLRRAHPSIINVRNIDGDTFMHVLANRWRHQSMIDSAKFDGSQWAALISEANSKGYKFQSCNSNGSNFVAALLPEEDPSVLYAQYHQRIVFALWVLLDINEQQVLSDSLMTPAPYSRTFGHEFVGSKVVRFLRTQELAVARADQDQEIFVAPQFVLRRYIWLLQGLPGSVCHPVISRLHGYLDCQTSGPIASPDVFKDLLEAGADPNDYNDKRQTCIMAIVDKMDKLLLTEKVGVKLIGLLIQYGADLRLLDPEGNTALHYAVRARLPDVVQQLIKTGIPVHAENLNGETAPQIAVRQFEKSERASIENSGVAYGRSQSLLVRLMDATAKQKEKFVAPAPSYFI
ncbi:hypothetical protein B0H66DRAFT_344856 [Apodospora peruviana]|uniref:Ankyrin n=1 Tax=Apodospora peruviana TaxID=516989 RepID=A0AAE0HYU0_9PEZI|nr:hypothetical protein B0H66DRAFT_344856 [Apodospora peruviana]